MRVLLFTALLALLSLPALAQEGIVTGCGAPATYDLETENVPNFCDYHSRRFTYAEQQQKFREQLQERQKNFIAPRQEALKNYNDNLEALRRTPSNNTGNQ
jgi:hypothetical protein